mmetsp:Transcript_96514/g.268233  ORF Transcript_96514/g.268233 Transcript_96514/m.268233 type:complete len:81 (-) Transcript_96514:77-319(-)
MAGPERWKCQVFVHPCDSDHSSNNFDGYNEDVALLAMAMAAAVAAVTTAALLPNDVGKDGQAGRQACTACSFELVCFLPT